MFQALSITLREGFEAALVIGVMLAFVSRTGRLALRRPIVIGAFSAIVASALAAWGLSAAGVEIENPVVEGALYLTAAVMVFSMVLWMQRTGGNITRSVQAEIDRASANSRLAAFSVAGVAFFMVAREGIETVLFLAASALDQGLVPTLAGGLTGIVLAAGLGVAVYLGAARVDLKLFFRATSIALSLLAIRFLGIGILELGEAGVFALPEFAEEGLEFLEKGGLATAISAAVVALPLGAIVWSFVHRKTPRTV